MIFGYFLTGRLYFEFYTNKYHESFRPPDDIPKQLYNDAGELRNNAVNASGTGSTIINLNIGPPPACAPPAPPKKRSLHNSTNDHEPHLNNS